jgi:hypothetical protein
MLSIVVHVQRANIAWRWAGVDIGDSLVYTAYDQSVCGLARGALARIDMVISTAGATNKDDANEPGGGGERTYNTVYRRTVGHTNPRHPSFRTTNHHAAQ